jgi:hypothetical protein
MITASFLVKDLLIDWRKGEAYFAAKLLDFDLAANNGGWQWAASTGCDAQPYFRIFNPVTQSESLILKASSSVATCRNCPVQQQGHSCSMAGQKSAHGLSTGQTTRAIVDHAEQRQKALMLFGKNKSDNKKAPNRALFLQRSRQQLTFCRSGLAAGAAALAGAAAAGRCSTGTSDADVLLQLSPVFCHRYRLPSSGHLPS